MRTELQKRNGHRGKFSATFQRFGEKSSYKGPPIKTALFVNVRDAADQEVADHLWFKVGLQLDRLGLAPGDTVEFEARVMPYRKGYRGHDEYRQEENPPRIDYCLKFPNHFRKVTKEPVDSIGLLF